MPDERAHRQTLLETHRRNLRILETQAAGFGNLHAPTHKLGEIENEKKKIAEIEAQLGKLPGDRHHYIPLPQNPHFHDLDGRLGKLEEALAAEGSAALTQTITGLGGVGKTSLALEFAYRHADEYDLLWWLSAATPQTLRDGLEELARALGLTAPDQETALKVLLHHLPQETRRWLLVFDNADEGPTALQPCLPRLNRHGRVLITSRHRDWSRLVKHSLKMETWSKEEGAKFLRERSGKQEEQAALSLSEELGGLPLALEQAAAFCQETGATLAAYLELYRKRRLDLFKGKKGQDPYHETVATTWNISFEKVEEESAEGAALLKLCAWFAPENIPLGVIRENSEELPEVLREAIADELAFEEGLGAAARYSLLEREGESLGMHRLLQAAARERLGEEERQEWAGAAVRLLNAASPDTTDYSTWEGYRGVLAHALAAAEEGENLAVEAAALGRLLNQAGIYLEGIARYEEAEGCYRRALKIDEASFGPDHPNVARDVNNLGSMLYEQGRAAEALPMLQRTVEIYRRSLGEQHPYTQNALRWLARIEAALRGE